MTYYFSIIVNALEDAIAHVTASLAPKGLGIITAMDTQIEASQMMQRGIERLPKLSGSLDQPKLAIPEAAHG